MRERGFAGLEWLLLISAVIVTFTMAVPAIGTFYREAALEYESEHLLADIRRLQSLSRLTTDTSTLSPERRSSAPVLRLQGDSYTLLRGSEIISRHRCLPSVLIMKKNYGTKATVDLAFHYFGNPNMANMTIEVFRNGERSKCRKIILATGGRIRLERQ